MLNHLGYVTNSSFVCAEAVNALFACVVNLIGLVWTWP